jgi:hypothetical protein
MHLDCMKSPLASVLGAAAALALAVLALSAAPAAASKSCGTVRVPVDNVFRVEVLQGPATCAKARWLVRAYSEGKGKGHVGRDHIHTYVAFPGGWKCGMFMGEIPCVKGPWIGAPRSAPRIVGKQQY